MTTEQLDLLIGEFVKEHGFACEQDDDDGWDEVKPVLFGVLLVLAAALSALMGVGLVLA